MITLLKRGAKALYYNKSQEKKARIIQTTVMKWRRKDGRASFLSDLISLRKTLSLCYYCVNFRMPKNWQQFFDYEVLQGYHAEAGCDYCREEKPVSLFLAGEGDYWQAHAKARKHAAEVRQREQRMLMNNRRYLVGV